MARPTRGGSRFNQRQLRPLAQHGDGAVAALGAQVLDVDATRLRDPQAQQPEQAGQGVIDRPSGGGLGQEGTKLHAVEAERGRLGVDLGTPYVLGRRLSQEAIDDGEAVEADDRGQATADGGPPQVALLLHPAGVELNVDPEHGEGLQADLGTPGEPSPRSLA